MEGRRGGGGKEELVGRRVRGWMEGGWIGGRMGEWMVDGWMGECIGGGGWVDG